MKTARPGHKFVLVLTLPSGQEFTAGASGDQLILIPIEDHGILRGAIAWDNTADLKEWLSVFKSLNDETTYKKILSMKPTIAEIKIAQ